MEDASAVLCRCAGRSEAEVRTAIQAGAGSLLELGRVLDVGVGCRSCHAAIDRCLIEATRRALASGKAPRSLRQLSLFDGAAPPRGAHQGAHAASSNTVRMLPGQDPHEGGTP